MSQPLQVDPDALRARATVFREIGTQSLQRVCELQTEFTAKRQRWGSDAAGTQFAKDVLPQIDQSFSFCDQAARALLKLADELESMVDQYEMADHSGAVHIVNAGNSTGPSSSEQTPATTNSPPSVSLPPSTTPARSVPCGARPYRTEPNTAPGSSLADQARPADRGVSSSAENSGPSDSASPDNATGQAGPSASNPPHGDPTSPREPANNPGAPPTSRSGNSDPLTRNQRTATDAARPPSTAPLPGTNSVAPQQSATPWSESDTVAPRQAPPRQAQPTPSGADTLPQHPSSGRPRNAEKKKPKKQTKPDRPSKLAQLGRELADRHNLSAVYRAG